MVKFWVKSTAAYGRVTIYKNYTSITTCCVIKRKIAAVNNKGRTLLALNNVKTAGVCTACYCKRSPVINHRRTGIARSCGDTLKDCSTVILNVIVACAAYDATVLDSSSCAACNGECCFACAGIGNSFTTEIKCYILIDNNILGNIGKKRYGIAVLCSLKCCIKRGISNLADLSNSKSIYLPPELRKSRT